MQVVVGLTQRVTHRATQSQILGFERLRDDVRDKVSGLLHLGSLGSLLGFRHVGRVLGAICLGPLVPVPGPTVAVVLIGRLAKEEKGLGDGWRSHAEELSAVGARIQVWGRKGGRRVCSVGGLRPFFPLTPAGAENNPKRKGHDQLTSE